MSISIGCLCELVIVLIIFVWPSLLFERTHVSVSVSHGTVLFIVFFGALFLFALLLNFRVFILVRLFVLPAA